MYVSSVFHVLGWLLGILGAVMAIPLLVSAGYGEYGSAVAFAGAMAMAIFAAGILIITFRGQHGAVRNHDAVLLVVLIWVVLPIVGAFPFYFQGASLTTVDSYFEAVSGFTTTGATIISHVSAAAHGILVWRALLQWLGGLAMIVLAFTILPSVASGALVMQSMLPQGEAESLLRRLRGATLAILPLYAGATGLCFVLLILTGIPVFDAFCMAMSTLATGGFVTRDGSIGAFDNPWAEIVLVIFMLIGATNFLLHRDLFQTRRFHHFRDPEFRLFMIIVGLGAVLFWVLLSIGTLTLDPELVKQLPHLDWLGRLRVSLFAAVSTATTTGYVAGGMVPFPPSAALFLMALMLIGGSTGSTAGGLKVMRLDLLVQPCGRGDGPVAAPARYISHPLWLAANRRDAVLRRLVILPALSGSALCNEPGLIACRRRLHECLHGRRHHDQQCRSARRGSRSWRRPVPASPGDAKWVLCVAMILGRMEVFAAMTLLNPQYWRR